MTKPHWLIVGPGALGQLYAGKLALAGFPVSLWDKNGPVTPATYQLTQLNGQIQPWRSEPVTTSISRVLIVTKIFQSDSATQTVLESGYISQHCPIILMHNGLGAGEQLAEKQQPFILASSRHGALKLSDNQVQHTGLGSTQIGLYKGYLEAYEKQQLTEELDLALNYCEWHEEILTPLWQKLIINSVINPLTARDRVRNGALLQPLYQIELEQLCLQACQVAELEGIQLESKHLLQQVTQVAQATANNRSSMLQDIDQLRPTEIDYINGYLIRKAHSHGLAVTAHEKLFHQIHQLSQT